MKTISTGEPSTLETYRNYAKKITESPHGKHEEVIADETQVINLIMQLIQLPKTKNRIIRCAYCDSKQQAWRIICNQCGAPLEEAT